MNRCYRGSCGTDNADRLGGEAGERAAEQAEAAGSLPSEERSLGVGRAVLAGRLELRSWAGGPNAKPVLVFLSQRRW